MINYEPIINLTIDPKPIKIETGLRYIGSQVGISTRPSTAAFLRFAHAVAVRSTNMSSFSEFSTQFKDHIKDLVPLETYAPSAERFKMLLQSMILKQTDLKDNPERFYAAHRFLSAYAHKIGPGFFIRFTVQFNLFAGTVLAIGNDEQKATLNKLQANGELGCFGLTERLAGVSSGLVVQTQCHWDEAKQMFRLHTPTDGACKNWISQVCKMCLEA